MQTALVSPGSLVSYTDTVQSVQCAVYSVQCAVFSVQCAVYSVQCAVCSVQCTLYSVQCTLSSVQYAVCSVEHCTMHFTLGSFSLKLCSATIDLKHGAMCATSCTVQYLVQWYFILQDGAV